MIADLHAHYAMHLVPSADGDALDLLTSSKDRDRMRDRVRALLVGLASRFANYRSFDSGPRVTVPLLQAGQVGVALSVLYSFFDELDRDGHRGAPPEPEYLPRLLNQLQLVEDDIAANHVGQARIAHSPAELDATLAADEVALVHCVEGGFHLGADAEAATKAIATLADRGVAYVICAHLLWRGVATNAPALPFLPDWLYRRLFPQPDIGLSEIGRAAVTAMVERGVLIDLSHMSDRAVAETLDLIDELDPAGTVPVIASHVGYRFGKQEYALTDATVQRIAARDGVVGLIMAQHQLNDGIRKSDTTQFDESFEVICQHIDRIAEATRASDPDAVDDRSYRYIGIGTDFDGFIKPTMGGLESAADLTQLEDALVDRYGAAAGEAICSGNALRVLRAGWRGGLAP